MPTKPFSIAFVSGKGGVGKTILAANFAWVCGRVAKTVLIDLDFQNQGCTGLFAPHNEFGQTNALESIEDPQSQAAQQPIPVAYGLDFFPAIDWRKRPSQEEIAAYVNSPDFQHRVVNFINQLSLRHDYEIVVLDCHGGVDAVSLSAFQTCDCTLMVTEADTVTFAGTLELLNYYDTKSSETSSELTSNETLEQQQYTQAPKNNIESSSSVKFIVNRLPGKFKWKDLEQIYQQYFSKRILSFSKDKSIFCYVPMEELLADSFGEYPFHVKLAPKSIFSKKINYMVNSLLKDRYSPMPSDYIPFHKFKSPRYTRKIERIVTSNEFKNKNYVLKFFVWTIASYSTLIVSYAPLVINNKSINSILGKIPKSVISTLGYVFGLVIFAPTGYYFFRGLFGLSFLYRDKYKFQKALFQAIHKRLVLWQRLSLAQLISIRILTTIFAYGIVLALSFLIFFAIYKAMIK